ncbi:MAG TPA: VOC family protein [Bryobacteraceae bacterium]|nr:VOC family protein [Bryobacteraceae bacterium]
MPQPIPEGYHTVTPYLIVKGASEAIEFYRRAFGAEELFRMTAPGSDRVMHAEIRIGDSVVMLADEVPERGFLGPQTRGGATSGLFVYVADVDAAFARALAAGATEQMPVQDMFWGDRHGQLIDPFGHSWSLATRKEDVSLEELNRRSQQFFAQTGGGT